VIEPRTESWLAIGYVAVFPSVLAYLFFNRGVELIGSAATGQYLNIMPAIGAGLAVLFLGEQLRLFHLTGAVLIAAGILLAARGGGGASGPAPVVAGKGAAPPHPAEP
jgi:drug/metabolite transporter (DMT)-like permease